jgi:hypothetical protein
MKPFKLGTAIAGALLVLGVTSAGCVADRPARNGVFNENQYVRKDFLIQGVDINGNAQGTDPGWLVRAAVTEVSTPNLFAGMDLFSGVEGPVDLVRFRVTEDKLQMLSQIAYSNPTNTVANNNAATPNSTGITEAVLNAWPATNVDLKYQVNLDGETTNFYQENQELDWQVRQWVKLQFDKNDMSDLVGLGATISGMVATCADLGDASATLVDGSFNIEGTEDDDVSNDYMEFTLQITIPANLTDTTCQTQYGGEGTAAARVLPDVEGNNIQNNVTVNLKYSFKRATPTASLTYKPWVLAEKDPIHRKYLPWLMTAYDYDEVSNLVAANQYVGRWDPTKPIVWYFDQNFPENFKLFFRNPADPTDPLTIQGATNALLNIAHQANPSTTAQVSFLDYNDGGIVRNYGDIRYNFLRWESDILANQGGVLGVTQLGADPRTGEVIHGTIVYDDYPVLDEIQRIDAFLVSVGASSGLGTTAWPATPPGQTATCEVGQALPLVTTTVISNHNANSTLYQKMQQYLNLNAPILNDPASGTDPTNNHLGPQDFAALNNENDVDFLNAYLTLAPYEVFFDPAQNPFVTPEGQGGVFGPAQLRADQQAEAVFQQAVATINSGVTPFTQASGVGGVANAVGFANAMRDATDAHFKALSDNLNAFPGIQMDTVGAFSWEAAMERDARMCVCSTSDTATLGSVAGYGSCAIGSSGVWETQQQYTQRVTNRFWASTLWHEFGHAMGLRHNFMGSIDQPNFTATRDASGNVLCDDGSKGSPTGCMTGHTVYNMLTSTVMEYNSTPGDWHFQPGWGYYDQGALAWIYSNNGAQPDDPKMDMAIPPTSRSGQLNTTYPYNDPLGFCKVGSNDCSSIGAGPVFKDVNGGSYERNFQRCSDEDIKYSPLCRQFDLGITPSEMIANEIDQYEWGYAWRNFRTYHKVWDLQNYAGGISQTITDMRRFMSMWAFDWAGESLQNTFLRIGINPPAGSDGTQGMGYSSIDYYDQLLVKFSTEMSTQARMMAAFDEAVIQQSSGERPYATVYDKFYGDVTQQGIILDKYFAMQSFVGLWVSDNYDQNEAGSYLSSWGDFDGDPSYQSVAETAVTSMIGETAYASYPYFIPTAVALFAQDSHSPSYIGGGGRIEAKDWIGGWTLGGVGLDSQQALIDFFKTIAINSCQTQSATCLPNCSGNFETCTYDVTDPAQVAKNAVTGAFTGPDGLNYIYIYIASRNQYFVARQDRNIVNWVLINNLNTDLIGNHDDGSNGAYGLQYPIEYTMDSYNAYEYGSLTADTQSSAGDAGSN